MTAPPEEPGRRVANPFRPDWTAGDPHYLRSMPSAEYLVLADLAPRGEEGTIYRAVVAAASCDRRAIEERLRGAGLKVVTVPGHLSSPKHRPHYLATSYPDAETAIAGLAAVPAPSDEEEAGTLRRQEQAEKANSAELLVRQIRAACIEFGPEKEWTWVQVFEIYQPILSTRWKERHTGRHRAFGPFGEESVDHWVGVDGTFYRGVHGSFGRVSENPAPGSIPPPILKRMRRYLRGG